MRTLKGHLTNAMAQPYWSLREDGPLARELTVGWRRRMATKRFVPSQENRRISLIEARYRDWRGMPEQPENKA